MTTQTVRSFEELEAEAASLVDEIVHLSVPAMGRTNQEPIKVAVRITDTRVAFGRIDLLVSPLQGEGSQWVQENRIERV